MSSETSASSYSIPLRYRIMENLHIVFWLFKDLSWCMVWKPVALVMIIPTLTISLVIAWRTRHMVSELCHNAAVCVWIIANSYWMIAEFAGIDENPLFGNYTYKHLAVIPFLTGIGILAFYYLWWRPRHIKSVETM
jgi:hypothetical protein